MLTELGPGLRSSLEPQYLPPPPTNPSQVPIRYVATNSAHEYLPPTGSDPASRAAADALDEVRTGPLERPTLSKGYPQAHVVRLPHASHMVFHSNKADVLREVNAFIGGLPC